MKIDAERKAKRRDRQEKMKAADAARAAEAKRPTVDEEPEEDDFGEVDVDNPDATESVNW